MGNKPIEKLMKNYEFNLIHTGGGFYCYSKSNHHVLCSDYREILISKLSSPGAPTSINEPVTIGFYSGENCDLITSVHFKNIKYYNDHVKQFDQFLVDGKIDYFLG